MTQSQTSGASRPRPTLAIVLFAALDIAGIVLFFTGLLWFINGEPRLFSNFPSSALSAGISIVIGFLVMVIAASRILIALVLYNRVKIKESGR